MARQIKPRLNFYYAGTMPIYAISQVYTGTPDTKNDRDLNGLMFCDIPWVLNSHLKPSFLNTLKQNTQKIWPDSFKKSPKLYALGVDAYDIAFQLNQQ